jgi:hypothetical protein
MAEDASMERRKEDLYLQPLVIDDTPVGREICGVSLPRPAMDARARRAVPPEFIETLSQGIRNYRRALR